MTSFKTPAVSSITHPKLLGSVIALLVSATGTAFGAADLFPQKISVSPAVVIAGNTVTVGYTVRNQGDTDTPASQTKIQIKDAAEALVATHGFTLPAIIAGAAVSENRELTIPVSASAGAYKAFIIVDNNREVAKGGTTENDKSVGTAFTVVASPPSAADLRPLQIGVSPTTVAAGGVITVTYTVRNQGGTNAPASQTKIQIKDAAEALVVAQNFTLQAIDAASSVSESRELTIPASATAGSYKVFMIVDNNREIAAGGTTANDKSVGTAFTVTR